MMLTEVITSVETAVEDPGISRLTIQIAPLPNNEVLHQAIKDIINVALCELFQSNMIDLTRASNDVH